MATSAFRRYKEEDDNAEEESVKRPMEYVSETDECICGWCGQLLIPNHTNETPEAHFKRCKNSKDNGLLKVFKDLRKVQHNLKHLNDKMDAVKAEVMKEIKADHLRLKTEFNSEILSLKVTIKTDSESLKRDGDNHNKALVAFNNKIKFLEDGMTEKMREMGVAQDMKMAEVNVRFAGVTETISTVMHSMLEGVRGKKIKSTDTNEQIPPKRDVETIAERVKSNDRDRQIIKRQVENQGPTDEATKKKKLFNVELSPSEQLTIPMNCFSLFTSSHLFQPSFKWVIHRIKNKMEQETFELTSDIFQWRGYQVQAQAKLELKDDDRVYTSLCLKDVSKADGSLPKEITVIPQVFYLLKDRFSRNARHKCTRRIYLLGSFRSSLAFNRCFAHKSWLNHSTYKSWDTVEIEIYVEPPQMTQLVHSYNGTLEWNMENYGRRLQLEKECLIPCQVSPYFYTSPRGYRVQVEVFLNGENEKKGLTARILFVVGNFDAQLLKSFPHSTTVTLINRKEPQRSTTKSIEGDIKVKKWYDLEICKLEEVKNFIKNDALLLKVSIESREKPAKTKLKKANSIYTASHV